MKRGLLYFIVACALSFVIFTPIKSLATATMNGCSISGVSTNTAGNTWIAVVYNNTTYNLFLPTTESQTNIFLATALTALSAGKNINLIVNAIKNWGAIYTITVLN